jgi:hypothetical protein
MSLYLAALFEKIKKYRNNEIRKHFLKLFGPFRHYLHIQDYQEMIGSFPFFIFSILIFSHVSHIIFCSNYFCRQIVTFGIVFAAGKSFDL